MRTLSRLVAALLGLVLLVGGLALALEVLLTAATGKRTLVPYDTWNHWARTHPWNNAIVIWSGLGALLLGLLLLLLTVRRRAPLAVPGAHRSDMTVSFARRPLEQAVGRLAERSASVENVSVNLRKRKAGVTGASLANDLPATGEVLRSRLSAGLDRLPLEHTPAVDVHLREANA